MSRPLMRKNDAKRVHHRLPQKRLKAGPILIDPILGGIVAEADKTGPTQVVSRRAERRQLVRVQIPSAFKADSILEAFRLVKRRSAIEVIEGIAEYSSFPRRRETP